jgi:serine/threonine protein phosphatase PrpC
MTDLTTARKPTDEEIDVHGLTHIGKVRQENQDHYLLATIHKQLRILSSSLDFAARPKVGAEERVAFIAMVADGVGSGAGGGTASATALESAMQYVNGTMSAYLSGDADPAAFEDQLQKAALNSHAAIHRRAEATDQQHSMATTLTLFLGVWPVIYLLQVGDSRYYLFKQGKLKQITRDQTVAQSLVEAGAMTETDAQGSRLAHVLTSALGGEDAEPIVTRIDNDWDCVHLLCSDGLTKHVTDARITEILSSMTSAKQAAEQMLNEALADGGTDNVTIIVGRFAPRESQRAPAA